MKHADAKNSKTHRHHGARKPSPAFRSEERTQGAGQRGRIFIIALAGARLDGRRELSGAGAREKSERECGGVVGGQGPLPFSVLGAVLLPPRATAAGLPFISGGVCICLRVNARNARGRRHGTSDGGVAGCRGLGGCGRSGSLDEWRH
jgi:hypothetical protein